MYNPYYNPPYTPNQPANQQQIQNYLERLNSYQPNNYMPQQNDNQLIRVNGIESAKAYPTQPNSTVALFDSNDDIMYIKSTDASNFPTVRRFRFHEEAVENVVTNNVQYVTVDEFNKFKEEMLNGKHIIQQQPSTSAIEQPTTDDSAVKRF